MLASDHDEARGRRADARLMGWVSVAIKRCHARAELGYWIGKPFWNHGYCTEASRAVVRYGFEALALERVFARYLPRNPASGRMMRNLGMVHEGRMRKHVNVWGALEDLEIYGILREEYTPGDEEWSVGP